MTAMAEHVFIPQTPPDEPESIGRRLHALVQEHAHPDFGSNIYDTVWSRESYRWGLTFPDHPSADTMNGYLLTALVRTINAEAVYINRQVDHDEIPSIALNIKFVYDSLREYSQSIRERRMTLKQLRAPLESSEGRIVDTHVAFMARPFIESPSPKGEIKPGQLKQLEGYLPAILAVQGIMYGKQVRHARTQQHLRRVQ